MTRRLDLVSQIDPSWMIDHGAFQLLKRRVLANAEDDSFDMPTMDAKWANWNTPTLTLTSLPGWLGIHSDGSYLKGVVQAVPAGDWYIETEVIWGTETAAFWGAQGLFLTNSATASSSLAATITSGGRTSVGLGRMNCTKFTNASYTSNYLEVLSATLAQDHQFFRIRKSGTTYYFYHSTTGKTWSFFYSASAATLGFTPTHFGLCTLSASGQYSFFNYFARY